MREVIEKVNTICNHFVWGPGMLLFFLLIGIWFTIRTKGFQIFQWKLWMNHTLFAFLKDTNVRKTKDPKAISQFQSFCTSLAATLGTGNITGVAAAIVAGGAGAIFWMWVSAFFGMMTSYAENVLGIRYRYKNSKGDWVGGAMVYMERGLNCRWLAILYSFFCIFVSFGMGNMTQANSIASGLKSSFSIPPYIVGICLMAVVGLVLVGGVKRVASVTEKVVPFMAIFYIAGGIVVLIVNYQEIPQAFQLIFKEAFQLKAVGGGVLGYGMRQAVKMGVARGIFSNEAGLGSSVLVHAAADVKEPVVQGMWGIAEVFIDTIVVCTVTALVIITTGVYEPQKFLNNIIKGVENVDGTTLTGQAFATVIPWGDKFLSLAIVLFAFATIIGWYYYGERTMAYLMGEKSVSFYKICYIAMILPGCMAAPDLIWDIADTLNGCMAIPNLIALALLGKEVITATQEYLK